MAQEIPVLRVYFMLHCPASSSEASLLERYSYEISTDGSPVIFCRSFEGRGSSFSPPFMASEIGFNLYEYDLELFEYWTNQLFLEMKENASFMSKWKCSESVRSSFVVNINSMTDGQRPVFFLHPEQTELLASFGASVFFDSYLMLSDPDE